MAAPSTIGSIPATAAGPPGNAPTPRGGTPKHRTSGPSAAPALTSRFGNLSELSIPLAVLGIVLAMIMPLPPFLKVFWTHLVLPASMKPADLARVIDRYEIFQPKKLLFTRLDETERYGALVTEAARRSLPISFLTMGQRIPDDLEPATKEGLVALVLGDEAAGRKSLGAGA